MSKSSFDGVSTGERLSRISENELLNLAQKNWENNKEISQNADNLIHTVTASCRSIPYTDEAAKEGRAKLFSMWYKFGPPSVFFTISPGDECKIGRAHV